MKLFYDINDGTANSNLAVARVLLQVLMMTGTNADTAQWIKMKVSF